MRSLNDQLHDENDNHWEHPMINIDQDFKCQFVLKKSKRSGQRINLGKSPTCC